ncbi:hypothetical protein A6046_01125 [[Haemophilus] ducreyi]|uniref:Transposon gamma-delta resolvase n=4 Tax=Haemophilus ducreyi TaxID=730 RepID=Q7VMR4_HAEDU|nr:recombinase family protein [[Haemophilus] ducreyi]AAP95792.1 transposon gamma-delta resolvase [[Haemophilus] ducreyi 35000HP]AKO30835.1 hypothetical protein RY60_03580 [[Haemophilus] ducreyi]AKO32273.1 hypothetical protein RZ57_03585 [[Haemophilus] ducreyi]AKO33727.1 hypothetical protein RZ58_03600 [[Haemophilus] ducreyi]AKO35175.1 hypothetical protein RZ59_03565 [[Haemophilus] ducreyi]
MRLFGYARVSTAQQDLTIQVQTLKDAGVEEHRIFTDKRSGKDLKRDGLELLKLKVEPGDMILVKNLDRLGRDAADMLNLVKYFNQLNVYIKFLDNGFSSEGTTGLLLITILAGVAQSERARILERTNEGRLAAMASGVKFGRKRKVPRDKIIKLFEEGKKPMEISRLLNVSKSMVYLVLKESSNKANWEKENRV